MEINLDGTLRVISGRGIHLLNYPAWLFNANTLKIVDGNQLALQFCEYEHHEFIGLSIKELWHGEDLQDILDDLETNVYERSFFGNLKHTKKSGEIVIMRVQATRLFNPDNTWVVHLVPRKGGY